MAQLGVADMRIPIQYALTYPDRLNPGSESVNGNRLRLDLLNTRPFRFEEPDTRRFPCLQLGRDALENGGSAPCALNAADEVAVAAFLERRLPFLGIAEAIERVLSRTPRMKFASMDDVLAADEEARRLAREEVQTLSAAAA